MTFPYDTPFSNNNKVDLDTFPAVPAINKVLAPEVNALTNGVNALATAVTAGQFVGLAGGTSPAVAQTGETRLKGGVAGLEVSFSGGTYSPVGGTVYDASGTVAGKVNLVDQTLGTGIKRVDALALKGGLSPAVALSGETNLKGGAAGLEVSFNGGAYGPVGGGSVTPEAWTEATYAAGWTSLSYPGYNRAEYMKDPFGFVCIRGTVRYTSGGGITVFTLPSGYRPVRSQAISTVYSDGAVKPIYVEINSSGVVTGTTSATGYLMLDNLRFDTR